MFVPLSLSLLLLLPLSLSLWLCTTLAASALSTCTTHTTHTTHNHTHDTQPHHTTLSSNRTWFLLPLDPLPLQFLEGVCANARCRGLNACNRESQRALIQVGWLTEGSTEGHSPSPCSAPRPRTLLPTTINITTTTTHRHTTTLHHCHTATTAPKACVSV